MDKASIEKAKEHFGRLMEQQLSRIETMKSAPDWVDYGQLKPIRIGILGGDGIGPAIAAEAQRVVETMLKDEVASGKVEFGVIEGLTIENRAAHNKPIPDDVLEEIKTYHVTLKGPTTTPRRGDPWPNIESANVALRKELDLFANVRPVRVPREGIDWMFFRENTEGAYALGSDGWDVTNDLAVDFKVSTSPGAERIIRLAFEHAKKNGIDRVTIVTKAHVVKTTDGKFLKIGQKIAEEYPDIECDDWYIDIMTAKLVDKKRRTQFKVLVFYLGKFFYPRTQSIWYSFPPGRSLFEPAVLGSFIFLLGLFAFATAKWERRMKSRLFRPSKAYSSCHGPSHAICACRPSTNCPPGRWRIASTPTC